MPLCCLILGSANTMSRGPPPHHTEQKRRLSNSTLMMWKPDQEGKAFYMWDSFIYVASQPVSYVLE